MKTTNEVLIPQNYYHIYNHAVGRDNLFLNKSNYLFFLSKYTKYLAPIVDTFAYCLMPNHFHFAMRIKSEFEIDAWRFRKKGSLMAFKNKKHSEDAQFKLRCDFISKQFSNLFSSYTQSFNKVNQRRGTLFERPFKRLHIETDDYFRNIIHYIHFNPVHHGFVKDLRDWKYSSFESFFSTKATQIKRKEVIEWFDGREGFFLFHQKEIDEKMVLELEF